MAVIERLKSRAAEAKRPGPGLNGSEPEYTPAHVGLAAVFSRCAVWITVSGGRRLGGGVARGFCTYTVHRTVYYVTVYGVFRTNPTGHGARCTVHGVASDAHCGRKLRVGVDGVKGLAWENFSHRGARKGLAVTTGPCTRR